MKRISFAFMIAAITLSGCSKHNETKKQSGPVMLEGVAITDNPVLVNGMLVFRNDDHFEKYLAYLQKSIAFSATDSNTMTQDEILKAIENQLTFTSLREVAFQKFERLNQVGWQRLDLIPARDFVSGLPLQSVLNENHDVQIEGRIMHFVNTDYMVNLPADDVGLLTALHGLNENASYEDLVNINAQSRSGDLDIVIQARPDQGKTPKNTGTTGGVVGSTDEPGYDYHEGYFSIPDECNAPYTYKLEGVYLEWNNPTFVPGVVSKERQQSTIQIDWGDGSPVETVESATTSNGGVVPAKYHTYASAGTRALRVKWRSNSPHQSNGFVAETPRTFTVGGTCHNGLSKNKEIDYITSDGTEKGCITEVGINQYKSSYNSREYHTITASTQVCQRRNGAWYAFTAQRVECKYTMDKQFGCGNFVHAEDGNSVATTSYAEISINNANYIGWTSIFGQFRFFNANVPYAYSTNMTTCN